ncbi:hypothetical protein [Rhodoferax sp. GW822-FHT02A01]|uniref:hypothetical protein n=1 Tax=Rhodoferax sp. GW822-FHT02A01 TaxID=3141537 RepID=UPI00315D8C09
MMTTTLERKNVAVQDKDRESAAGNPSVHGDYGFAVSLMQFLVVPAFVLDAHGRVMIWNKACERLTGMDAQRYLYADAGPIFDTDGRLLAVVQTLRDMTIHKKAQLELERLAVHGGMTGILNRRGFDHALQVAWGSAARSNT